MVTNQVYLVAVSTELNSFPFVDHRTITTHSRTQQISLFWLSVVKINCRLSSQRNLIQQARSGSMALCLSCRRLEECSEKELWLLKSSFKRTNLGKDCFKSFSSAKISNVLSHPLHFKRHTFACSAF